MSNKMKTIRTALINLGYPKGAKVRIYIQPLDRCAVFVNNRHFGIFDLNRSTFVD